MKGYIGWRLPDEERMRLLEIFKPKYPDVIADHITHQYPASPTDYLPNVRNYCVVGISDDGKGLEALVISLDGKTKRPDKKMYHITWSIDKKMDINRVILLL